MVVTVRHTTDKTNPGSKHRKPERRGAELKGTHGMGFPSIQRVPKPGSRVRAFRSSWVPRSSGASLLWEQKSQPVQQFIKTIHLKEETHFLKTNTLLRNSCVPSS